MAIFLQKTLQEEALADRLAATQLHLEQQAADLEQKIEELLRRAPDVPDDITIPNEPLRFHHFAELMEKNGGDSYRPPLLMTATNLTKRRLEIISSLDDRYMNVPIAKAVRASARFPVFFTPTEMPPRNPLRIANRSKWDSGSRLVVRGGSPRNLSDSSPIGGFLIIGGIPL